MKKLLFFILITISFLRINAQTHDYAKAQYLSTYFLGGQRCGNTNSWSHGACHTTDGQQVGKDLSGGWHDCGDNIKFHVTGGYTALAYLYGYDKFPEVYLDEYSQASSAPPSNGIPDILDEVKIQTDYLIKCVNGSTIYWEIGGSDDHDSFSEPVYNSQQNLYTDPSTNLPTNIRPVRSAVDGHSNAFGDAAAALALMAIKYKPYDAAYAQSCLTAAKAYYNAGKTNPTATGNYETDAQFYQFMKDARIHDNLGMAAIMLYRATTTSSYLDDAKNYANGLPTWEELSYYALNPLLFLELYKITDDSTYLNNIATLVDGLTNESCGYHHSTDWGSLRNAGSVALIAALYHQETQKIAAYNFAKSNIDFILGSHDGISDDAPKKRSFLIGYNELKGGYPKSPHHAAAFGKGADAWTLWSQEKATPGSVSYKHELKGGLAGGPESACDDFIDNISNYRSSEYCSYYNAAFTGAVAYINKVENNVLSTNDIRQTKTEIKIYPNPVTDKLSIKVMNGASVSSIKIVDFLGKVIYEEANTDKINLSGLKKGVYILDVISNLNKTPSYVKFIKN